MKRSVATMLLLLAAGSLQSAEYPPAPRLLAADCDRACLYGFVDQYLDALKQKDATRLAWARNARYTENNVELPVGEGLWGTITGLGSYKLRFADSSNGQVSVFGALDEADATSAYALRLKVVDRKISEAEMLVVRIKDFGALGAGPNPFANPRFDDKPILLQNLKPGEGRPRARMVSLADGYFDTLQLNDGQLFTEFDQACNRIENGLQTTNNPAMPLGPTSALGCADQFKLGVYRYDDRLRARRYPLVDEERGIVLAAGFIDHSGRLGEFKLTDGTANTSVIRHPHSFYFLELFKIVDGKLRQIESVFITVPYNMPSPWSSP
ncbi:MAG: hypothetical protein ABIP38_12400 [Steroidobacteraceae bacterium]